MYYKTSSFLIVGMKKSGFSIAKLLLEKGASVYCYDENPSNIAKENLENIASMGGIIIATNPFEVLTSVDVLVLSPGVPVDNEIAIKARELKKRIVGELELGSYFITNPLVAITGTNGKTTTSSLISHVLSGASVDNLLVGNVGTPISSKIKEFKSDTIGVVEVSSFQLETATRFTPHIACILNVTADHLDRHYNMENYLFLKGKLIMNLRESEFAVLNLDDENVKSLAVKTRGKIIWFSVEDNLANCYVKDGIVYFNGEEILSLSLITLDGLHNVYNVLCAICVFKLLGLANQEIQNGIKTFKGVKHRLQNVNTINGVTFYNDSKSTNPDSCLQAVLSMTSPTVLLMGGFDKGLNYDELFEQIKNNQNIKSVVLTGDTASNMFYSALKVNLNNVSIIKEFDLAIKVAKDLAKNGYNVLFSPATSSFDLFSGYEERGDKFIEIVNSFK